MRKILSVFLVLAMASVASAYSVWFVVDDADAKPDYTPSDIITINVVADFEVGGLAMAVAASDGMAESINGLHPNLMTALYYIGDIINEGGLLIRNIAGGAMVGLPGAPASEVLYSFEFHVPYVDDSTWIIIDDFTDYGVSPPIYTAINSPDYMIYIDDVTEALIHVIPEPMTIVLLGLGGLFLRRRK